MTYLIPTIYSFPQRSQADGPPTALDLTQLPAAPDLDPDGDDAPAPRALLRRVRAASEPSEAPGPGPALKDAGVSLGVGDLEDDLEDEAQDEGEPGPPPGPAADLHQPAGAPRIGLGHDGKA